MGNTVVHNNQEVIKCIKKSDAFKVDKKFTSMVLDGIRTTKVNLTQSGETVGKPGAELLAGCLKKDNHVTLLSLKGRDR